jgi:hypothetical protein
VFTWIVRVKVKLFTVNFLGGAKLFTVGCGEWFLRLSLPPMNNFGGTIRQQRQRRIPIRYRNSVPPFAVQILLWLRLAALRFLSIFAANHHKLLSMNNLRPKTRFFAVFSGIAMSAGSPAPQAPFAHSAL